jgi:hypothetical protein
VQEETERLDNALRQANQLAEIITKAGTAIVLLADKRVTLEEKMIRSYLHNLSIESARLIATIHTFTKDGAKGESQIIDDISASASQIHAVLDQLLKVVRYNLNYLEQYFEHEFYIKLEQEHRFIERLSELEQKLSAT